MTKRDISDEQRMQLNDAVLAYIRQLCKRPKSRQVSPEPAEVAGHIGSLMGIDKAERKKRRATIYATFFKAWEIAGLSPLEPRKRHNEPTLSSSATQVGAQYKTLGAAVAHYVQTLKTTNTRSRRKPPQPSEVASRIGLLLGLSESDQRMRKSEIWDAFFSAWNPELKAPSAPSHPASLIPTPPATGDNLHERHSSCFCDTSRPNVLCGFCHARKYGAQKTRRGPTSRRRANGASLRSSHVPHDRFQLRCSKQHSWMSDASFFGERSYAIPKCNQCGQYFSAAKKIRATFKEGKNCDPRCRKALLDICVCSCAGANHGIWAR
jgi:hypothetical protein